MFEAICLPQAWKIPGSNVGNHITQDGWEQHNSDARWLAVVATWSHTGP